MKLGDLHLVKAQCSNSTLVAKIKLVERCFVDDATVNFVMYETAPKPGDGPILPYFAAEGKVFDTDNAVVAYLAREGAPQLLEGGNVDPAAITSAVDVCQGSVVKGVKTATKSKNAEAMSKNKAALLEALVPLEQALSSKAYLGGSQFSLADVVAIADLRAAFETVLEADDRAQVPALAQWYTRCYEESAAVKQVWKAGLVLCEESAVAAGKDVAAMKAEKKAREKVKQAAKKASAAAAAGDVPKTGAKTKESKLGIQTGKDEDFGKWYSTVCIEAELISYYPVSGCYILRPWAFAMWEVVQGWFDAKIKSIGVENCMFPLFITEDVLRKEADHIEDFEAEVAWVTRSGKTELAQPLAIRPTSETCMYPYFAQWIRSHRDLPLKLNQWTNVVRWEFKHPTPFIRSREFLWQEGHTAHQTLEESLVEVIQILDWYAGIYEELLAVPVVKGWKSEKEKFAGAYKTATVEAFIPGTGKGVQGATSHALGTNFAKMFGIKYESKDTGEDVFAFQNSWGCTTRTLGVMVMTHGDDKGLVLPPVVAPKQLVIIPIINSKMTEEEKDALMDKTVTLERALKGAGVRAIADRRDNYNPGWKYAHWELKGVPLRCELGPKDMVSQSVMLVRRDNGAKESLAWADLGTRVPALLLEIQADMLARARGVQQASIEKVDNLEDFKAALARKHLVLAPWGDTKEIEEVVKTATRIEAPAVIAEPEVIEAKAGPTAHGDEPAHDGEQGGEGAAKCLCIPFEQPNLPEGTLCFFSGVPAKNWALFGRSY